ncbi:unnamed protein product [Pseudo-nitzschia multistriata]|uniref:Peptidase A1 domain-containing protein n=1 Tax=Pseudo-nitzschia multistriata TaxID=183589 RepID=A0A448YVK2_9STRA|nr:unnamed protein product [Pseudo-nitzschia multistriata]
MVKRFQMLRRYPGWWSVAFFLLPLIIPTIIVVENDGHAVNSNTDDHQNRKLLEHGLRGGNVGTGESWTSPGVDSSDLISAADPAVLSSNVTIPLHAHSGTWHVHVYVGSPPQRQTLIVDTGSKAMAFPCKTCETCTECCGSHASPYFDPFQSTTHRITKCGDCLLEGISKCPLYSFGLDSSLQGAEGNSNFCTFTQRYTEGSSWTATEVEDIVWLGSEDLVESVEGFLPQLAIAYPFGCQTSSKGLFQKQYADGILGLSIHNTSIVTALYGEGLIPQNAFSLCFTHEGGVMSLGGTLDPKKYHFRPIVTTPLTRQQDHGYYSVEVIRLLVGRNGGSDPSGEESIVITDSETRPKLLRDMNAGKGCILDSGTTDSYFPSSLARVVRKAVIDYASSSNLHDNDSGNGYNAENVDLFSNKWRHRMYTYAEFQALLPTVTVVLANNATVDILPLHYMERVPIDSKTGWVVPWKGSRELANRLYFEESAGSVLGTNAFFGYDLLFDSTLPGRHRVGIAPADCHAALARSSTAATAEGMAMDLQ